MQHSKYRPDIDGLRGIAVLGVVVFHAFGKRLAGGYVGVDVFFVISGFLITTIIIDGLDRGTFTLWNFYQRRIRRIFPALTLVLAFAICAGWFLYFPPGGSYAELGR
jgi:peptidoglycan/LPS O-acetylase OafA/YrhL